MAIIKKNELDAMSDAQRAAKIVEIEKAILELKGEGRADKAKPLRKAIAKLKTPSTRAPKQPGVQKVAKQTAKPS